MSDFSHLDHQWMARAIKLAQQGHFTTTPNPRVGCVLVKNGEIIAEGFHQKAGEGHAEVNAINNAKINNTDTIGATAYVTLEPCSHTGKTPPCAQALINAGISKVIAAMVDPNPQVAGRGLKMLNAAGIATQSGLLSQEAAALNTGFIKLMTTQLPYVRCKLAASLDGKTAMASGESKWITGDKARADVQRLRAQSCAVITGADSVIIDNAKMNVRFNELLQTDFTQAQLRQPTRVIIDSQNRLTPALALFSFSSPVIIVRTELTANDIWPAFVEQLCIPANLVNGRHKVDLAALLKALGKRGFNDILLESGATLAGAFIAQNLVDELILYQAPKLLGADSKSLIAMPEITELKDAKALAFTDITMVGADLRITANFKREA
ncbi:MAG: bifunctional diaminohydroxyphosphoribosylaminopyrimidine deaminase/5-amino-6-(5-phosphoribosylamino)uracil reductase RibD [Thalassotalea sp.]